MIDYHIFVLIINSMFYMPTTNTQLFATRGSGIPLGQRRNVHQRRPLLRRFLLGLLSLVQVLLLSLVQVLLLLLVQVLLLSLVQVLLLSLVQVLLLSLAQVLVPSLVQVLVLGLELPHLYQTATEEALVGLSIPERGL